MQHSIVRRMQTSGFLKSLLAMDDLSDLPSTLCFIMFRTLNIYMTNGLPHLAHKTIFLYSTEKYMQGSLFISSTSHV